jgi:MazG family protein
VENPKHDSEISAIIDLIEIIETLRGSNGCPWDRKQTPSSMIAYLIEEVYELAEAVETDNYDEICEELGDVLFHIFFMARMYQESGHFSIKKVARAIADKMIRRHPHVFGNDRIEEPEAVIQNWHKIKLSEKRPLAQHSILDSVPDKLPALMRAYNILDRAARTGLDSEDIASLIQKTSDALASLELALHDGKKDLIDEAFGNIIFSFVNLARKTNVHPETALAGSLRRFIQRFKIMEKTVSESGRDLQSITSEEKDHIWREINMLSDSMSK